MSWLSHEICNVYPVQISAKTPSVLHSCPQPTKGNKGISQRKVSEIHWPNRRLGSRKITFHIVIVFVIKVSFTVWGKYIDTTRSSVGIATDYGLDGPGSNPGGGRDFPPVQTGPGAHPASCTMGSGSFPGVKSGRGVLLTTHRLLMPRSWKSRGKPLPTLWATPGLQREHFNFI